MAFRRRRQCPVEPPVDVHSHQALPVRLYPASGPRIERYWHAGCAESREKRFGRGRAPPNAFARLDHENGPARPGKFERCHQPVVTTSDDDNIIRFSHLVFSPADPDATPRDRAIGGEYTELQSGCATEALGTWPNVPAHQRVYFRHGFLRIPRGLAGLAIKRIDAGMRLLGAFDIRHLDAQLRAAAPRRRATRRAETSHSPAHMIAGESPSKRWRK